MGTMRVSQLKWPLELGPGDERFVESAVAFTPGKGRVKVVFLSGEAMHLDGAFRTGRNTFLFRPSKSCARFSVKFVASPEARPGTRIDLALSVFAVRYVWWRILLAVLLIVCAVAPTIAQLFRWTFLRLQVSIGDAIVVSVPVAMTLGLLIAWRKVLAVVRLFLCDEVYQDEFVAMYGNDTAHIDIVDQGANCSVGTWTA
jgi:hypothetical protein